MSMEQDEETDLLGRIEKLERAAHSKWRKAREFGLFLLAVAGTLMGAVNFFETRSIDRRIMAEQYLEEAWDILGGHPGASMITAMEHPLHELTLAKRKIKKALILAPGMPEAHRRHCVVLRRDRELDRAREECEKAIDLDPKSAAAFNSLGNVLRDMEEFTAAIDAYEQALAIDSNFPAYSNLITTLRLHKEYLKAISVSRMAIAVFPESAVSYYDMGMALLESGRVTEGLEEFEKAIELNPGARPDIEEALMKHGVPLDQMAGSHGEPNAQADGGPPLGL